MVPLRELWMVDLTYPTVIRGLLDLTRKTSNLTLKCIGSIYMEAMLLAT